MENNSHWGKVVFQPWEILSVYIIKVPCLNVSYYICQKNKGLLGSAGKISFKTMQTKFCVSASQAVPLFIYASKARGGGRRVMLCSSVYLQEPQNLSKQRSFMGVMIKMETWIRGAQVLVSVFPLILLSSPLLLSVFLSCIGHLLYRNVNLNFL